MLLQSATPGEAPVRSPLQPPMVMANVLTSIAFAAVHLYAHPPLWALAVFFPSLVFGYFRDRSGRLEGPILLHIGYNASYFMLAP